MGLFSKIFGGKAKSTYEHPQLGVFKLVYSKGERNLWSSSSSDTSFSARGSESQPFKEHLDFLIKSKSEVNNLHEAISKRLVHEFKEADLKVEFSEWKEQFKIVDIAVEKVIQGKPFWTVTFVELNEPYAHYNLHIEGQEPKDISIDT